METHGGGRGGIFLPAGCSGVTLGSFITKKPLGSHSSLWLKGLHQKINNPLLAKSNLISIKTQTSISILEEWAFGALFQHGESSFPPPNNFTGTGHVDAPQWVPVASQAQGSESPGCSPEIRTELSLRPARTRTNPGPNVSVDSRSGAHPFPLCVCTAQAHRPFRPPGGPTVIL